MLVSTKYMVPDFIEKSNEENPNEINIPKTNLTKRISNVVADSIISPSSQHNVDGDSQRQSSATFASKIKAVLPKIIGEMLKNRELISDIVEKLKICPLPEMEEVGLANYSNNAIALKEAAENLRNYIIDNISVVSDIRKTKGIETAKQMIDSMYAAIYSRVKDEFVEHYLQKKKALDENPADASACSVTGNVAEDKKVLTDFFKEIGEVAENAGLKKDKNSSTEDQFVPSGAGANPLSNFMLNGITDTNATLRPIRNKYAYLVCKKFVQILASILAPNRIVSLDDFELELKVCGSSQVAPKLTQVAGNTTQIVSVNNLPTTAPAVKKDMIRGASLRYSGHSNGRDKVKTKAAYEKMSRNPSEQSSQRQKKSVFQQLLSKIIGLFTRRQR